MLKYLQAENLKNKGTFIKKLILIAPIVTLLIGFMTGKYFEANSFNQWYMMILPGYISIMAVMTNEKDQKKLRYRAVFGLPISLKKVWISKVLVNGIYMTFSCMILLVGIFLGSYLRITPIPVFSAFCRSWFDCSYIFMADSTLYVFSEETGNARNSFDKRWSWNCIKCYGCKYINVVDFSL